MVKQLRRWLSERSLVLVGDQNYCVIPSYGVIPFLSFCQRLARPVTLVTRLRLDAALYEPAPERKPGQMGRPRRKGERLPTLQHRAADASTTWTKILVPR